MQPKRGLVPIGKRMMVDVRIRPFLTTELASESISILDVSLPVRAIRNERSKCGMSCRL